MPHTIFVSSDILWIEITSYLDLPRLPLHIPYIFILHPHYHITFGIILLSLNIHTHAFRLQLSDLPIRHFVIPPFPSQTIALFEPVARFPRLEDVLLPL